MSSSVGRELLVILGHKWGIGMPWYLTSVSALAFALYLTGKTTLINMNDLLFVIWCLLDAENVVIDLLNSQFLNIASII